MPLPDLPIIDAHQHFWDLDANHLPWLCDGSPIPFRYCDDYARDTRGLNLIGSVFVENA